MRVLLGAASLAGPSPAFWSTLVAWRHTPV